MRPLAIDLFCGLGGWTEGLLAEGYEVVGFDIERHVYGEHHYPAQLVLQDVLTLHGSQFRDAALIVASPPCQEYSYMAMPWSRAKKIAAEYRSGARDVAKLTALFDACFRLQREACEAGGRHIPLVVENVRGAQEWVGRSRWNYGSYHLWGDVPALMPIARRKVIGDGMKVGDAGWREKGPGRQLQDRAIKNAGGSWFAVSHNNVPHSRGDAIAHTPHMTNPAEHGFKSSGLNWSDRSKRGQDFTRVAGHQAMDGIKQHLSGPAWFDEGAARHSSKSPARKFASAMIAKIPLPLSRHIARTWWPLSGAA